MSEPQINTEYSDAHDPPNSAIVLFGMGWIIVIIKLWLSVVQTEYYKTGEKWER
jgi:hypothetical protein